MNEEMTGKCLRQMEHTCDHMWHGYSIAVNQVIVSTVNLSKWWLQLSQDKMWFLMLLILVILWPSLLRGDCMFCWYWWNCWSSLFRLSNLLIYMCTYQTNRWSSLTAFAIWYIGAMWCQLWNRHYGRQKQQHTPNMSLTNTQTSFFSVYRTKLYVSLFYYKCICFAFCLHLAQGKEWVTDPNDNI